MKAKTIDEIREHLAKGGRVIGTKGEPRCWSTWEATKVQTFGTVYATCGDQTRGIPFGNLDWQLLPLEEKEPVRGIESWGSMKAKTIDEIREHLAKGGRALARDDEGNEEWEVVEFNGGYVSLDVNGMRFNCPIEHLRSEVFNLAPPTDNEPASIEVRTWGAGVVESVVVRWNDEGDVDGNSNPKSER